MAYGNGGALHFTSISSAKISDNSQFINNRARSGGAIFFNCMIPTVDDDIYPECDFVIDETVKFKDNFAQIEGGAIQIKSADLTFVNKS